MTEGGADGRGVCRSLRALWQWTRAAIERKKVDGNLQAGLKKTLGRNPKLLMSFEGPKLDDL